MGVSIAQAAAAQAVVLKPDDIMAMLEKLGELKAKGILTAEEFDAKKVELFDDHSPLQLFASGQYNKRHFTLIGRLQYKTAEGAWAEWNALFDDGQAGWLAEDNGAYV